jgi:hypothetical protein
MAREKTVRLVRALILVVAAIALGGWDDRVETIEAVDVSSTGAYANGAIWRGKGDAIAISSNGQFVAFSSNASNLVPGVTIPAYDDQGSYEIYMRDLETGQIEIVSVDSSGQPGKGLSISPSISRDGRFVAFSSNAQLVPTVNSGGVLGVYVRDRWTGHTQLVSLTADGHPFPGARSPVMMPDGTGIYFLAGCPELQELSSIQIQSSADYSWRRGFLGGERRLNRPAHV